jgi:DNA helicase HerA-like ATPase
MEHTCLGTAFSGQAHWLTLEQRLRHIAVNGKTGYGKSTLLKSVLAQDIARGDGVLLLDPAGTLAEEALAFIPPARNNQVCYFNIADRDCPVGFNIFADVPPERRSTLAEQIVSAFKSIWLDMWGPQLERLLRASSLALLDTRGTSMVDILRLYFDPDFRAHVLARCRNPVALVFFEREFGSWSPDFLDKAISPVLNKLEAFLSHDLVRNILGQAESTLHMEQALARNRIVVVNLARGAIGDAPAFLMGSLILARTEAAALQRDLTIASPFHVFVDEAQNFKSGAIGSMYSQIRKFKVSLFLVTQDFSSLDDITRAAITANADTIISFRLSPDDAQDMARLFNREHQEFNPVALQNLNVGEAHFHGGRLHVDPDIYTFPDRKNPRKQSRLHYGRRREKVEPIITQALLSLTKRRTESQITKIARPRKPRHIDL